MFHEGNLHEKVIFSRAYRFIDLKVCVQVLFLGWGGVGWGGYVGEGVWSCQLLLAKSRL